MFKKRKKNNEKIYVDFIGAYASGKSTIRQALYEEMKKDNIDVFLSPNHIKREKFKNLQKLKHLIPQIIFNFKTTFKLLYYWKKFNKINKIFGKRPIITENLIFYKYNFKYFLAESSFHAFIHKINFNIKDIYLLLNLIPTKKYIFIFVDTPPRSIIEKIEKQKINYSKS